LTWLRCPILFHHFPIVLLDLDKTLIMAPKSKNDIPAYVLGVGLTKFIKPRAQRFYPEMGYEAGVKALLDAKITFDDVETGVACYCYGDTTSGQRIFYQFGMTG
jgi:sterol carrier protein 2